MFWRSWNQADKTLLFAAVLFFLALALVVAHPKSLLARGFLACADAALVGTLPMLGTFVTVLHRALPAVIPVDIAFAGAALWILRKRRMRRKMQDV